MHAAWREESEQYIGAGSTTLALCPRKRSAALSGSATSANARRSYRLSGRGQAGVVHTHQVAGHGRIRTRFKPVVPVERAFYAALAADPALAALAPHTPRFYGVLRLAGAHAGTDAHGVPQVAPLPGGAAPQDEPPRSRAAGRAC
jgi:hypothetical protein